MSKRYFGLYLFYVITLSITIHGILIEDFHLSTVLVELWYNIFYCIFVVLTIISTFVSGIYYCIMSDETERDVYLKSHCDAMKDYIIPLWTVLVLIIPVCALVQLNHPWYALAVLSHAVALFLWRALTIYGYRLLKKELIKK